MSSIQKFQDNTFWAWAITSPDVDSELAKAMNLYRQRYGRDPHLLFCAANVEPQPVRGLQIERRGFVPKRAFYFAATGREG